jgi:hypothetical protein
MGERWLAAVHPPGGLRRERDLELRVGNHLVEAIIGLPTDMFFNTGIIGEIRVSTPRLLALSMR